MNHSTCALATNLDEVERAREGVVGVVGAQDRERLAHGLRLLRAGLRALLELLVRHLAGLLQVQQELLVRRQGVAGVFEVLVSESSFTQHTKTKMKMTSLVQIRDTHPECM